MAPPGCWVVLARKVQFGTTSYGGTAAPQARRWPQW